MNNALIFNCGQDEDISCAQFLSSKYGITFASMVVVRKLETSNLKTLEPPIDLNLLQSKSMSTLILILKES